MYSTGTPLPRENIRCKRCFIYMVQLIVRQMLLLPEDHPAQFLHVPNYRFISFLESDCWWRKANIFDGFIIVPCYFILLIDLDGNAWLNHKLHWTPKSHMLGDRTNVSIFSCIYSHVSFAFFIISQLWNTKSAIFLIGFYLLYITISLVWPSFEYRYFRYDVRDHDLLVQQGVLFRRWCSIPHHRIQHIWYPTRPYRSYSRPIQFKGCTLPLGSVQMVLFLDWQKKMPNVSVMEYQDAVEMTVSDRELLYPEDLPTEIEKTNRMEKPTPTQFIHQSSPQMWQTIRTTWRFLSLFCWRRGAGTQFIDIVLS